MRFDPPEVNPTHVAYACLGGFVVIFSMFSSLAKERLLIGEVVFATLFGIIVGPSGANVFTPRKWGQQTQAATNDITLEVTRVVLALGVFAIGVELPKAYMRRHWRSLVLTVVPVMAWGWFVSAGLIVGIFPDLSYLSALVISACLTPTDPILAAAVVGGHYADKNVPGHIRRLLAAESGANDGLSYPFLWLPLYLTLEDRTGTALKDFFTVALLYQVVLSVVLGSALGFFFALLMKVMEKRKYIGRDSYAIQFISLSLFTIGVVALIGSDDVLAAFAAGCTVSWDGHFNERTEESMVFASIVEVTSNCAVFVFIGAWIDFPSMNMPELHVTPWRLAAFFFSILFVRRIPPMLLLYKVVPDIHTWKEALFAGWFGPMGMGAVFISTLALKNLPHPSHPPQNQAELIAAVIQPIVAFTILGSILVHGLSIPAFSLAKKIHPIAMSRTSTTQTSQTEWLSQTQNSDGSLAAGHPVLPISLDLPRVPSASADSTKYIPIPGVTNTQTITSNVNQITPSRPSSPLAKEVMSSVPEGVFPTRSVAFASSSVSVGGSPLSRVGSRASSRPGSPSPKPKLFRTESNLTYSSTQGNGIDIEKMELEKGSE